MFGRISYFRTWLEGEMKEATVCKNGFDADTALPRNLNPRNWSLLARRPAVHHTRINVGNNKKRNNKKKYRKGKKNKKE